MTVKQYPRLGETVHEARLSNGLLARVVRKPGFAKTYAFLAVNYGSMDTKFAKGGADFVSPQGVAHYLEHKMFDMPDCNVMQLFSQYGGSPNAFTSYDLTAYYVECTGRFRENLELLLRYVTTPWFTEQSVEKERGIIAQEIRMYEDSPETQVSENLFAALYAEHPVRKPIAGTVESIGTITPELLNDCFRAFYRPANMLLCVVGDVDAEKVAELAAAVTGGEMQTPPQRDYGKKETMTPAQSSVSRAMEVSMPTFAIGFKCEPAETGLEAMRREIIGDLAAEILVGESSALYQRLYEDGLIDAGFSAGYESVKDACQLSANGDSDAPEQVLEAILQEAERIRREGFEEELFRRLKKSSLGRRTRDLDSFESICYRICAYHFDGADYFRFPEAYASVTPADVRDFLARTVRRERAVLSVVQPKR